MNLEELLRNKCLTTLKSLNLHEDKTYVDRLEMELSVVIKLGFVSYFLVVEDIFSWCKKQNILTGPGRGSAGSSLIFYLLGVTALDPVKYGLPFSRFLNANRADAPDVDMDFDSAQRERVVAYLRTKYGEENVALISTYGVMKPRSALRDLCRVKGKLLSFADEIANLIPPPIAGRPVTLKQAIETEPRLSEEKYKEIVDLALQAENTIRTRGVHAAGVVVTPKPIYEYTPICTDKQGNLVCQLDKKHIEKLGLIKFDILGLNTLTIISDCIALIKANHSISIDPYKDIPLDDLATFNTICSGRLDAVFQFEGSSSLRDLTIALQPKTLEDLSIINALYRPGPIQAGYVEEYVARKRGEKEVSYICEAVKPVLQSTYGLFIMQEQIMKLSQILAGYTELQADELRKAIGRKDPELMEKEKDRFIKGCIDKQLISQEQATTLFGEIKGCADYLFNSSHSLTYAFLGYITAWLKTNYAPEFWTAVLSNNLKSDKVTTYVKAMQADGISLIPPNVCKPSKQFSISKSSITYGLSGIRDCNSSLADTLRRELLQNGEWKSLEDFIIRSKVNKKVLIALAHVGALDSLIGRSRRIAVVNKAEELIEYRSLLEAYTLRFKEIEDRDLQRSEAEKNKTKKLPALKPKAKPEFPILEENLGSELELIRNQRLYAGTFLDAHPLELYKSQELRQLCKQTSSQLDLLPNGEEATVIGVVTQVKQSNSKKMKQGITSLVLEDLEGLMNITVYGNLAQKHEDLLEEGKLIQIVGKVSIFTTETEDGEAKTVKISAKQIKEVPPPKFNTRHTSKKDYFLQLSSGKLIFTMTEEEIANAKVEIKGDEILV